jgi:hypothetical protein
MSALPSPDFQPSVPTRPARHRRRFTSLRSPRPLATNKSKKNKSKIVHEQQLFAAIGKIVIYSSLSVLGMASLVELTKYSVVHQSKLHQLQAVIKDAQQRAQVGNEDFQRSFDPHRAKELMQESSYKVAPGQKPIVIYNPENNRDR